MKHLKHVAMARMIGQRSFELQHYEGLPRIASAKRQVEALKQDQRWQRDHLEEVCGEIDRLIKSIEEGQGK